MAPLYDYASNTDFLMQNLTMVVGNPSQRRYANEGFYLDACFPPREQFAGVVNYGSEGWFNPSSTNLKTREKAFGKHLRSSALGMGTFAPLQFPQFVETNDTESLPLPFARTTLPPGNGWHLSGNGHTWDDKSWS